MTKNAGDTSKIVGNSVFSSTQPATIYSNTKVHIKCKQKQHQTREANLEVQLCYDICCVFFVVGLRPALAKWQFFWGRQGELDSES
eukprot:g3109.t1